MRFTFAFLLLALSAYASTSNGIITVTSPANSSSDTTPVTVSASATTPPTCSTGIAAMGIYPTPGNLLFKTSGNSFSKSFILNPGSYPNFVVQEWDKCGGISKLALKITVTGSLPAPITVPTWGYAFQRNNVNTHEYILTPTNVRSSTFGKKFSYAVDGYIYGQPLFVPNLKINGAVHNVVYVATENNSVYAFDADVKAQLWHRSFGSAIPCSNVHACGVTPTVVGITATPVIDTTLGNIYVADRHFDSTTLVYSHTLHSLNLLTGADNVGSPVRIAASVAGTGYDAVNGTVSLNQQTASDRAALLELNGVIYVAFGQPSDHDPYHGWIIGFSATGLARSVVFNVTPNGERAGVWGAPLASDGTFMYIATGNGTWDGSRDWGDSYLKLSIINGTLSKADFFTPFNVSTLSTSDWDLGSAMATLLPTLSSSKFPHIMIGAGKEGRIYVINRDSMGQFDSACDCQIVQSIPNAVGGLNTTKHQRNYGTPPYWNGNVYFSGTDDYVKRFHLNTTTSTLTTTPSDHSPSTYGYPGSNPVVSANGGGSGILWAVDHGANVLHAYDATHVSTEFYNTTKNATRDALGSSIKFAPPLVINGKVYVGTQDHLVVYGIL